MNAAENPDAPGNVCTDYNGGDDEQNKCADDCVEKLIKSKKRPNYDYKTLME